MCASIEITVFDHALAVSLFAYISPCVATLHLLVSDVCVDRDYCPRFMPLQLASLLPLVRTLQPSTILSRREGSPALLPSSATCAVRSHRVPVRVRYPEGFGDVRVQMRQEPFIVTTTAATALITRFGHRLGSRGLLGGRTILFLPLAKIFRQV